jgi:ATP-binding cassette subfamily C protein
LIGRDLLKSYLLQPYTFHLARNTAELLKNINIETIRVFNFVLSLLKVCSELCVFGGVVLMLLWVNPIVVICSVGILGTISGIFYKCVSGYLKILGQQVQSSIKLAGQAVLEGLGSIKEVKLFGREDYFPTQHYLNMMDNSRALWRSSTINTVPRLFLEVIAVGGVVLVVIIIQMKGDYDIKTLLPTLSLFVVAVVRLMPSLSQIVANLQLIRFEGPAVDVIYKDMKLLHEQNDSRASLPSQSVKKQLVFRKAIRVCNLGYVYPSSDIKALHGVMLEIGKGQAVAFAGSSGASKTTLANLILGLLRPDEGHIYVDDQDIFQNLPAWQRSIGYVPQAIYLLDTTIRNNIAFGLEASEIDDAKVWKAIRIAQLETFVQGLPDGINTIVGENGIRLSGGQRQRLGIARALYHEPEILVLDEATSSLDGETEREVNRSIELLSGQKTLIIIAHRLSTVHNCDRIYFMKNGTIADSGTFAELVRNNDEFRCMAESGRLDL